MATYASPRTSVALAAVAVAAALLAFAGQARAASVVWSPIGPYGGTVEGLAVDPDDPDVVYAATRGGVWKSTDGGDLWRPATSGLTELWVRDVAVDPFDSQTLYAVTGEGTFRSENGAATWQKVGPIGSNIALSQTLPRTLFVDGFRSRNQGDTWTRLITDQVGSIAIDPTDANVVYASTPEAFLKSTNGGMDWDEIAVADPWGQIHLAAPSTVHLTTTSGSTVSENGGGSWDPFPLPAGLTELALSRAAPGTMFAFGRVAGHVAVAKTVDGGDNWGPVEQVTLSAFGPFAFATSSDPATLYVGTFGHGAFRSADGGSSFMQANTGMAADPALDVAFDPADSDVVYASLGLEAFGSVDGGAVWSRLDGLDTATVDMRVEGLAVDASSMLFAARAPAGGMGAGSVPAQVLRSDDGGENWDPASTGLPSNGYPRSLYADPRGSGTLFATVDWLTSFGGDLQAGLFKTTNGGDGWTMVSPATTPLSAVAFDPASERVVLAEGGLEGAPERLLVSDDWGATWDEVTYPPTPVASLGFGHSPDTIYAGGLGHRTVMKSTDGGETWTLRRLGQVSDVRALVVDPADWSLVYAGTQDGGLWISGDAGDTWSAATPGITGLSVFVVTFAGEGPALDEPPLYLGLAGRGRGGVWRMVPAPHSLRRPALAGVVSRGRILRCGTGRWSRADTLRHRWVRGGRLIPGAVRARYRVKLADVGRTLGCRVTAVGPGGTRYAFSRRVRPGA